MSNQSGDQVERPLDAPAYTITGAGRNVGWRWVDDEPDDDDA